MLKEDLRKQIQLSEKLKIEIETEYDNKKAIVSEEIQCALNTKNKVIVSKIMALEKELETISENNVEEKAKRKEKNLLLGKLYRELKTFSTEKRFLLKTKLKELEKERKERIGRITHSMKNFRTQLSALDKVDTYKERSYLD